MNKDELAQIKEEYIRLKTLLDEEKELNKKWLANPKDKEVAERLDDLMDGELFMISDEEDIYRHLENEFKFKRGKGKKLYFLHGFLCESPNGVKLFGKKALYIPRRVFIEWYNNKYYRGVYAICMYLASEDGFVLVPARKLKSFARKNYLIDIGRDIDADCHDFRVENGVIIDKKTGNAIYTDEINIIYSYHTIRYDWNQDNIDLIDDDYNVELYKYFANSDSEDEAIKKFVLVHKNEVVINRL